MRYLYSQFIPRAARHDAGWKFRLSLPIDLRDPLVDVGWHSMPKSPGSMIHLGGIIAAIDVDDYPWAGICPRQIPFFYS